MVYSMSIEDSLKGLKLHLKETGRLISRYTYKQDDLDDYDYDDDAIKNNYTLIENEIADFEFVALNNVEDYDVLEEMKYELFKIKERLNDLKSMYRSHKMKQKKLYIESMYITSFSGEDVEDEALDDSCKEKEHRGLDDEALRELTEQERLLETNTALTDKLQNVNTLMKSTLLAGEINIMDLESSTSTLSQLSESYAVFGDVLNKTNLLVKSINKASKNERVMIYRSLYFFIAVCCWILWRRIFKRPVLLILWLLISPLKFIFWSKKIQEPEILSSSSKVFQALSTLEATMEPSTSLVDTATAILKDEL